MTHLRQLRIEELQRRNFAETTIRSYVHRVEHFSRYFHRSPDQLGPVSTIVACREIAPIHNRERSFPVQSEFIFAIESESAVYPPLVPS